MLCDKSTFLYNNLLLVALALTILWGVTPSVVSEVVNWPGGDREQALLTNFFLHTFVCCCCSWKFFPRLCVACVSLRALG